MFRAAYFWCLDRDELVAAAWAEGPRLTGNLIQGEKDGDGISFSSCS